MQKPVKKTISETVEKLIKPAHYVTQEDGTRLLKEPIKEQKTVQKDTWVVLDGDEEHVFLTKKEAESFYKGAK